VKSLVWFHIAAIIWFVFLLFWIVSARKLKAIKRREPLRERVLYMVPMVVAYALLFNDQFTFTALGRRFVPLDPRIGVSGIVITALGVAFAIWARLHLGENWSATVTVKAGHELIESGPYRTVRHPIYTGMLVAMAGSAIALGQLRGLLALVVTAVGFYFKARKEERYMLSEFAEKYQAYASRTGMLLPRFLPTRQNS
jgi:protein-S-isoprenylcysteine O-methyltransferase Ste14